MINIPKSTIIKKIGQTKGNTTAIMCGVHGNERQGIMAVNNLMDNIKIDRGIVYFIYANILAIKNNIRFIDKDMNRLFNKEHQKLGSSYEENRVQEIKKYLNKSNFLLDIHSSNSTQSTPFIITEHINIANIFPVRFVVSGFKQIEPGSSDWYMDQIGGKGFCLESGTIKDIMGTQLVKESIINFLKFTGNIRSKHKIFGGQVKIRATKLYKTKTDAFHLSKHFADFEFIKKGQTIGFDGESRISSQEDALILFARNRNKKRSEGFILLK